jgi:hypothetical protein
MSEHLYYSKDYWFNEVDKHGDVSDYGTEYYAYQFFEKIVLNLTDIPDNGYIVVLGTNKCVSFNLLCEHFGNDRCIGYDIDNPTNHPCVKVQNILDVSESIPISFVHNDIGNYTLTPTAKFHAQQWAAQNVVEGGYFLGRNNLNRARIPIEQYMERSGFLNINMLSLTGIFDLSNIKHRELEGHMISKKVGIRQYV